MTHAMKGRNCRCREAEWQPGTRTQTQLMGTLTPEEESALANFSRIPQFIWLVSIFNFKGPLKAVSTGKPPLTKVLPGLLRSLPLPEPPRSSPMAAASGLSDGRLLGLPLLKGHFRRPTEQGAMSPTPKGWWWESHMSRGGDHSGNDAWPHPPKSWYAEKCHCCCTKVWYYQPHATGKWIKMPLTQQIKLTAK